METNQNANAENVRVHKASNLLQAKVGTGKIDEGTVERCQNIMDNNDVEFAPVAKEFLDKLSSAIQEARKDDADKDAAVKSITEPVMQLKANAAMFKYHLVGNLANVMLSFLEAVKELDNDVIEIVSAHHQTLSAIVIKQMKGDGGAHGKEMEQELKGACARYFGKRKE